ncbi:hypothetical protein, partial [Parapedobacter sp. 10938]|uniref:hypothetical protein n=1 Tax=Parapedobacter flavus TaxID=3110225 RepID=UPI002DB5871D
NLEGETTLFGQMLVGQTEGSSGSGSSGSGSSGSGSSGTSDGSGGSGGSGNNDNKKRETLTGQQLFVTKITGQAAINAGIVKGMLVDFEMTAEIAASIETELLDAYTIRCHNNGTVSCLELEWTVCASGGCPPAGWEG